MSRDSSQLSHDPYGPAHDFVGKPYEKRVPRAVRVKSKGPGKTRTAPLEKRSRNEANAAMTS